MADSTDDLPAAVLTDSQRKYLRSIAPPAEELDVTLNAKRVMRSRIRERIVAGIIDYRTIFDSLEERDRDGLLEEWADHAFKRAELRNGIVGTLAFLYEISDVLEWDFKQLLTEAIEDVYSTRRRPGKLSVDGVEFEVHTSSWRPLADAYRAALQKCEREELGALTERERLAMTEFGGPKAWSFLNKYREVMREERKEEREDETLERIAAKLDEVDYSEVTDEEYREHNRNAQGADEDTDDVDG